MQADEWEEIKRVFDAALRFEGESRTKFLEAACFGHPAMQETVAELLRAHEEASGFLDDDSALPLPHVFEPGQLVAERFRIVRLITRGGMGEVYETYDERLSLKLALKTLRPEYASDQEALERFRREIRVTREFSHPNLCRVYELVEHRMAAREGRTGEEVITCLTMQLMAGETLQDHIRRAGALKPAAALPLLRQICGAIQALHDNGIIHRDLKPSNIMITPGPHGEPRAIVMDFGLTKAYRAENELFESRSDFRAGAPFYLAPELLRGERPSVASDIYALGLTIDEMVTGGGAFSGETVEALLYQKLWADPKDPSMRKASLPAAWCEVIRRCLEREPEQRFRATREILETLQPVPSATSTKPFPLLYRAQRALLPGRRKPRGGGRTRRRSMIVGGSLAAAVLAVLGGAAYYATRPVDASVLIFEFENQTGDKRNDYLSKGTTWELERELYDVAGMSVRSYHEPRPRGDVANPGTRFAIDGYVETEGDLTRVLVKVTETATRRIVWMNRYDTKAMNALQMQTDIASGAVTAMRGAMLAPRTGPVLGFLPRPAFLFVLLEKIPLFQRKQVTPPPTASPEAMEAYTRGRALWEERSVTSDREAVKQYERALELDPKFALAEADLAGAYLSLSQFNGAPRAPLLAAAREHAEAAVQHGPQYAQAYTSLAAVEQAGWDWGGAERDYRKAIAMNPKFARAHRWFGGLLIQFGRFEEGLKEAKLAVELDPYDYSTRFSLATYYFYAGQPEAAASLLEKTIAQKNVAWGHHNLAYVYARLGSIADRGTRRGLLEKAKNEVDLVSSKDNEHETDAVRTLIYAIEGDVPKARLYLKRLISGERAGTVDPMDLVHAYAALGRREDALQILAQLIKRKDPDILYMKVDPFLDALRPADEYQRLLTRAGL